MLDDVWRGWRGNEARGAVGVCDGGIVEEETQVGGTADRKKSSQKLLTER